MSTSYWCSEVICLTLPLHFVNFKILLYITIYTHVTLQVFMKILQESCFLRTHFVDLGLHKPPKLVSVIFRADESTFVPQVVLRWIMQLKLPSLRTNNWLINILYICVRDWPGICFLWEGRPYAFRKGHFHWKICGKLLKGHKRQDQGNGRPGHLGVTPGLVRSRDISWVFCQQSYSTALQIEHE